MENKIKTTADKVIGSILFPGAYTNIQESERIVSAAFGAFMFWRGIGDVFSKPSNAIWEIVLGGALLYRGATGYCAVKERIESCGPTEERKKGDIELIVESM